MFRCCFLRPFFLFLFIILFSSGALSQFSAGSSSSYGCHETMVAACSMRDVGCGTAVMKRSSTHASEMCRIHPQSGGTCIAITDPVNSYAWVGFNSCDSSCPSGEERVNGHCVSQCPPGLERDPVTGQCGQPACPVGQSRNPSTGSCMTCPAGVRVTEGVCGINAEGKPEQCEAGFAKLTIGGQTTCTPNPEDPGQCGDGDVVYVNGINVCKAEQDACKAAGGTHGIVNAKSTCLPSDYAQNLPTCNSGSASFIENGDGAYGFACASVTPKTPPTNVTQNDPTGLGPKLDAINQNISAQTGALAAAILGLNKGTTVVAGGGGGGNGGGNGNGDGDGDGDGEGDGEGEGEGGTSSASNSCQTPPVCKEGEGECALLLQQWYASCPNLDLEGASGIDDLPGDSLSPTRDVSGFFSGLFVDSGSTSACPAPRTLSLNHGSVISSFQPFCDLASQLRPMVIFIFSWIGFRIVAGGWMGRGA
jgi:hypothetical protein